jgi:hypothetical protein
MAPTAGSVLARILSRLRGSGLALHFARAGDHVGQQRDDGAGQQGVTGEDAAVAGHDP